MAGNAGYDCQMRKPNGHVYERGKFTAISEPNGTATAAEAINNAGQIVGSYTDNTSGPAGVPGHAELKMLVSGNPGMAYC